MPTNIDDKELARLEYLIEASESCGYSTQSDDPNMQYLAAACHYTPALVAEVRRLRAELDAYIDEDQTKIITLQRQIMDVLRDKLEAWEWLEEVRACKPWNDHPYWESCGNSSNHGNIFDSAVDEYKLIYKAAREAVHADRE